MSCFRSHFKQRPLSILLSICGLLLTTSSSGAPAVVQQAAPAAQHARHGAIGDTVTDLTVENTAGVPQTSVPFTFGQIFARGDVAANETIAGKTTDGPLPLQFNIKATYPDGSVRHAIISGILPQLPVTPALVIALVKASPDGATTAAAKTAVTTPSALLAAGFSANVKITIGGEVYSAAAEPALSKGTPEAWLTGPIVNEWLVRAPLITSNGHMHPHLSVRYAIRSYRGSNAVKVDVVVENDWAYQTGPTNFTYDVAVDVGGKTVYAKSALTHYHHSRWRKTFWWGSAPPQVNIRENIDYLIDSKALPNYDRSVRISELDLRAMAATWGGSKTEPMGAGVAMPGMPTTGGRPDIGLLPGWAATYLLSMDKRARDVTLGTADLAGSWSMHYRDQATDRPINLADYPYMTILGVPNDAINPRTRKSESFPICVNCSNPNIADSAHEPNFSYLPYLVTGDYYHLEELQFWAMWNAFETNPGYREAEKGLMHREQVRDQAWSMRNIAEAAFITPDRDPLKAQLMKMVGDNLAWYNASYTDNKNANKLGVNIDGYALGYDDDRGVAPWMDDFFTASIGHIAELGFPGAAPLLFYKAKFPVSRMTDPGYCWIFGAAYALDVRASANAPFYTRIDQAYQPTLAANLKAQGGASLASLPCGGPAMAAALKLRVGEMNGYSDSVTGFPSNMQPALAYSVDVGAPDSVAAWRIFMGRSVKPDYAKGPQFAIVPRY